MERYLCFLDNDEFKSYIKNIIKDRVGSGSEGTAYKTIDNKVLKVFNTKYNPRLKYSHKDDIIMAQDYDVSTYLLPEELLFSNGIIAGYITEYFPGNVINFNKPYNSDIKDINFDKLIEAKEKMVQDTTLLTKDNILISDLTFNLLFNNNKLGAIDTFGYYKDSKITLTDNLKQIDYALLKELHFHDFHFCPDYNESLEYNLKRIKK